MNVPRKDQKLGDVLRQTYFLGVKTQQETIGNAKKCNYYLKRLKCEICQRVFRFEYGLQSHSRQEHGVVNPAIPTTSKKYKINDKRKFTFQRKKRKKSSSSEPEEIKISDSEPEEDPDSSESFETVERRIVISKKKPKISKSEKPFYMGLREAEILGENEAFQPKLKLEDIYKHPERHTTLPLPIKDEQDDSDQVRTDEESISKSDFVNKVRRRSESQKSSPDIEEIESKPKTVIKKERIERILKEEPMSTDEPEIIVLD